jgi:hypothetical protein
MIYKNKFTDVENRYLRLISNTNNKNIIDEDMIMKYYNNILYSITKKLKNSNTTNTTELHDMGKKMFGNKFSGVFPVDKLKFINNSIYAICNLDNSNQIGSHWISVIKHNNSYLVYDSFGRKSSQILPSLVNNGLILLDTEYDPEQAIDEENCGQRSLSAIYIYHKFGKNAFLKL